MSPYRDKSMPWVCQYQYDLYRARDKAANLCMQTYQSDNILAMAPSTETVTLNTQSIRVRTEDVGPAKPAAFASEALTDIDSIPVFTDKYEERKWAKAQMVGAFRVFAKLGFADGAAGHVSLRGMLRLPVPRKIEVMTHTYQIPSILLFSGSVSILFERRTLGSR